MDGEFYLGKVIFLFEMSGDELDRRHSFPGLRGQRQWVVFIDLVLLDHSTILLVLPWPRGPLVAVLPTMYRSHRIYCHAEIIILSNRYIINTLNLIPVCHRLLKGKT